MVTVHTYCKLSPEPIGEHCEKVTFVSVTVPMQDEFAQLVAVWVASDVAWLLSELVDEPWPVV